MLEFDVPGGHRAEGVGDVAESVEIGSLPWSGLGIASSQRG